MWQICNIFRSIWLTGQARGRALGRARARGRGQGRGRGRGRDEVQVEVDLTAKQSDNYVSTDDEEGPQAQRIRLDV